MIIADTRADVDAVARHYDELDEFYRGIWGEHVHHGLWRTGREDRHQAVLQLVETVADRAEIGRGTTVCDVGCGYGATARWLAAKRGARVTALTVTPRQHQYARSLPSDSSSPDYLHLDWLENALPTRAFDALIAIESIEHMSDQARALREAARVLKPGGRLVICAWLAGEKPFVWQESWLLRPICVEGRLPQMRTQGEFATLIERAGFDMERVEDLSTGVRRTWWICMGRACRELCRRPAWRRFLFNKANENRIFAVTMFRIWLAYLTGAMRYGMFTARKARFE